jgi:proline utilization trans-activator
MSSIASRLAAATGNPVSINDDAIELDMPTDFVGYSTALPLRTNFKISKVLSRIITGKAKRSI